MIAAMPGAISLNTPIEDLHNFKIARLGQILTHNLAKALASQAHKKDPAAVTVEDLLNYFPMRYEDRSRPALIKDLHDGAEASLELTVTKTNGYAVRNPRGYGRPSLYIFEVYGIDGPMTGKEVIVWWFVSGRRAYDIVKYYTAKLERGTRFVTFGRWEWEGRRSTFKLRLNNAADELEIVSPTTTDDPEQSEENQPDPSLAAVHVGRRVPVYRKLGEFNSKRVREIVHAVLTLLSDKAIEETLPADLRHRAHLIGRAQAVREIHFPPPDVSMDDYEQAKSAAHQRMIFEDFFWVTFAIGLKRGQREKEVKAEPLRIDKSVKDHIASVMPFKLVARACWSWG